MSGCINWTKSFFRNGYGQARMKVEGKWKGFPAHRAAWIQRFGPIPQGLEVMHLCDNRACVNLDHLALGTSKANSLDMLNKGRWASGEGRGRGEDHGNSKLEEIDVRTIRSMYGMGYTKAYLAKEFQVTQSCVHSIITGRTWKHVS